MTTEEIERLDKQIGKDGGWEIIDEDNVLDPSYTICTEEKAIEIAKETIAPYEKQIRGINYLKLEVEKLVADWEKICAMSPSNPYTQTTLEYLRFFLAEIEKVIDGSLADHYERIDKFKNEEEKK